LKGCDLIWRSQEKKRRGDQLLKEEILLHPLLLGGKKREKKTMPLSIRVINSRSPVTKEKKVPSTSRGKEKSRPFHSEEGKKKRAGSPTVE